MAESVLSYELNWEDLEQELQNQLVSTQTVANELLALGRPLFNGWLPLFVHTFEKLSFVETLSVSETCEVVGYLNGREVIESKVVAEDTELAIPIVGQVGATLAIFCKASHTTIPTLKISDYYEALSRIPKNLQI